MTTTPQADLEQPSPVLVAPDGCTSFRASSVPTAEQIADWCHPRTDPQHRYRLPVKYLRDDGSAIESIDVAEPRTSSS